MKKMIAGAALLLFPTLAFASEPQLKTIKAQAAENLEAVNAGLSNIEQQLQDVSARSSCDAERSFYQKLYSDALSMKTQAQNLMALFNQMRSAWDSFDEALYKSYLDQYNSGLNRLSASSEAFNSFANQSATLAKCYTEPQRNTACDHVYVGKEFDARGGALRLKQQYIVVGVSERSSLATIRSKHSDYRQEVSCYDIP